MSHGDEARRFLRGQHHGVLSTLSLKLGGYPFGSVTPFVLDEQAAGGTHQKHRRIPRRVEADSFRAPVNRLALHEEDIIQHMNADHAHNPRAYCRQFHAMAQECRL